MFGLLTYKNWMTIILYYNHAGLTMIYLMLLHYFRQLLILLLI
ncbi:unnamed protein product [Timema podura]|uniref:Uncharacterized protein n=1 Tax=Timema podura TaxID=61482 RepID=A0ABN7PBW2_TIMPD|nr:unnamed protein product [Timema podura]